MEFQLPSTAPMQEPGNEEQRTIYRRYSPEALKIAKLTLIAHASQIPVKKRDLTEAITPQTGSHSRSRLKTIYEEADKFLREKFELSLVELPTVSLGPDTQTPNRGEIMLVSKWQRFRSLMIENTSDVRKRDWGIISLVLMMIVLHGDGVEFDQILDAVIDARLFEETITIPGSDSDNDNNNDNNDSDDMSENAEGGVTKIEAGNTEPNEIDTSSEYDSERDSERDSHRVLITPEQVKAELSACLQRLVTQRYLELIKKAPQAGDSENASAVSENGNTRHIYYIGPYSKATISRNELCTLMLHLQFPNDRVNSEEFKRKNEVLIKNLRHKLESTCLS